MAKNLFTTLDALEQHIRDLLRAGGEGDGFINDYIDCIFSYASLEEYERVSDEEIWDDYRDWMAE